MRTIVFALILSLFAGTVLQSCVTQEKCPAYSTSGGGSKKTRNY